MKALLHSSLVLQINRCWQPLEMRTVRSALSRMFDQSSDCPVLGLDVVLNHDGTLSNQSVAYEWADWVKLPVRPTDDAIGMTNGSKAHGVQVRVPRVVIAQGFADVPKIRLEFNKRGLYTRDRGKCGYCGVLLHYDEATIDHVIPRKQKGPTTWENCTIACEPCNFGKADRTPAQAGLRLLRGAPKVPPMMPVMHDWTTDLPEHRPFLMAS